MAGQAPRLAPHRKMRTADVGPRPRSGATQAPSPAPGRGRGAGDKARPLRAPSLISRGTSRGHRRGLAGGGLTLTDRGALKLHDGAQHWVGPRAIAMVDGKGGAGQTPAVILLSAVLGRHPAPDRHGKQPTHSLKRGKIIPSRRRGSILNQDAMRERIASAVNALTPTIWDAQSQAIADAYRRCKGLPHSTYPSLRPVMVRPCFRELLLEEGRLPEGWQITGDPAKMVEIYIQNQGLRLRYLKERRTTYPGGVPAAGHSQARRAYWAPTLFDPERSDIDDEIMNLLLLWDMRGTNIEEDGFVMRVVHTVGAGTWGRATPIDLSVELSPEIGVEKYLRFEADPQETDFYADLSENEGARDGSA